MSTNQIGGREYKFNLSNLAKLSNKSTKKQNAPIQKIKNTNLTMSTNQIGGHEYKFNLSNLAKLSNKPLHINVN